MVMYAEDNSDTFPLMGAQVSWDDLLSLYDGRNLTQTQMQTGSGVNGQWGALSSSLPGGLIMEKSTDAL